MTDHAKQLAELKADLKRASHTVGEYLLSNGRVDIVLSLMTENEKLQEKVSICEKAFELDDATKLSEVGDLNCLQFAKQFKKLVAENERLRGEAQNNGRIDTVRFITSKQRGGQLESVPEDVWKNRKNK